MEINICDWITNIARNVGVPVGDVYTECKSIFTHFKISLKHTTMCYYLLTNFVSCELQAQCNPAQKGCSVQSHTGVCAWSRLGITALRGYSHLLLTCLCFWTIMAVQYYLCQVQKVSLHTLRLKDMDP